MYRGRAMKPTSPEDRELEALAAGLSAAYRKGAGEQPPARLDAAILEAARSQAARPRKRDWHMPASIAAMLVIGVSLALMTSEIEDPLPPLEPGPGSRSGTMQQPASADASSASASKAAGPAVSAPQQAPQAGRDAGSRPSRERLTREQVQPRLPAPGSPTRDAESGAALAPAADLAEPLSDARALREREATSEVVPGRPSSVDTRGEDEAAIAAVPAPEDWLNRIEGLLREGKVVEAKQELARFSARYPDHPLPPGLRDLSATRP